jgi:D-3-phosphoglycerate dehydrogenase
VSAPAEAVHLLETIGTVDNSDLVQWKDDTVLRNYHVLIVGLGTKVDRAVMEKGGSLKIIATATTGTDHIDTDCATRYGIKVVSLKGKRDFLDSFSSTAEFTFGLILSLVRQIPWRFDTVKEYQWTQATSHGFELRNKTLGIIGFGRLGKIVAGYARSFAITVIACDPGVQETAMRFQGVEPVVMSQVLKRADIISLHANLAPENEKMIGEMEFSEMKKTAIFINTARGQLIDESALLNALRTERLAGAALDVLSSENKPRQSLSTVYIRSGDIYATKRDIVMKGNSFKGKVSLGHIIPPERFVNIDNAFDWFKAEYVLKLHGNPLKDFRKEVNK